MSMRGISPSSAFSRLWAFVVIASLSDFHFWLHKVDTIHVNDLGYDILDQILPRACGVYSAPHVVSLQAENVLQTSSVCSAWRRIMQAYIFKYAKICCGAYDPSIEKLPKVDMKEHSQFVRIVDISLFYRPIESIDISGLLDNSNGIGEAKSWPKINRLEINNVFSRLESSKFDGNYQIRRSTKKVKSMADHVCSLLPNITHLRYVHEGCGSYNDGKKTPPSYLFLPQLISNYSEQLRILAIGVNVQLLPKDFAFPKQLTSLRIDMDDNEREMIPKIFASSLQLLEIVYASPDITWNWFTSNTGDDTWFNCLKKLDIIFPYKPGTCRPTYLNRSFSKFESAYRDVKRSVHFPVLEILEIDEHPFEDDSFLKLFEDCPLKKLKPQSLGNVQPGVLPRMLANLASMDLEINYDCGNTTATHKKFAKDISRLLSSTSAVRSATIRSYYHFRIPTPLPETTAWSLVQKLELGFQIDVASLYQILAQMPKLKHFEFKLVLPYANASQTTTSTEKSGGKCPCMVNSSTEYLKFYIQKHVSIQGDTIQMFISDLLPLVPSLVELKLNTYYVEYVQACIPAFGIRLGSYLESYDKCM